MILLLKLLGLLVAAGFLIALALTIITAIVKFILDIK